MKPRPSAGGIIVGPEGKIVLVEQHANSWSFPKGGIEEGETELEAAVREIYEETGLKDITLVEELGSYERYSIGPGGHDEAIAWGLRKRTLFLFTTDATAEELKPIDSEVTRIGYYTLDEAIELLTHPKDKEFLVSVHEKVERAV